MPLAELNRKNLDRAGQALASMEGPPGHLWELPEKIVQFGCGRFLRAFVADFVDRANRRGVFNGRIVAVQSTGGDRAAGLDRQDCAYSHRIRGLVSGSPVDTTRILLATSRALRAADGWQSILKLARQPELALVVSNTTEVGIVLDEGDRADLVPPLSFPGKLTLFLHERYRFFSGREDKGLIIVPCELIEDNGGRLRQIVLENSARWGLSSAFRDWVLSANRFCSSLVDRIVTNATSEAKHEIWSEIGFRDELPVVSEPYSLWAIEGDESVRKRLSFAGENPSVIVDSDIGRYSERKIRVLNGLHTTMVAKAFLSGKDTMLESMRDTRIADFAERAVRSEIGPSLNLPGPFVLPFIDEVLERFRNPFIEHRLLDILRQSTSKMRLRVVPSILEYHQRTGQIPRLLARGFGCTLLFLRSTHRVDGRFFGERNGIRYEIHDDKALAVQRYWEGVDPSHESHLANLAEAICSDRKLWGHDLSQLPGFSRAVADGLKRD